MFDLRAILEMAALRGLAHQRRRTEMWVRAVWAWHAGAPWSGPLPPAIPPTPDAVAIVELYADAQRARRAPVIPTTPISPPPPGWLPARRAS